MKGKYKKVNYNNQDSVKVDCYRGEYKKFKVSIIYSSDHRGWLFYIEHNRFNYNSMRGGILFESMQEAIEGAEKMIDDKTTLKRRSKKCK